jgi:Muconolactone delta-isomerase
MEFLVTMTTHVPDGTPPEAVDDVRAREAAHSASWLSRATCSACGVRRCSLANGAPSDCSPPPTSTNSSKCSPRCHCESGAPTRSRH